MRSLNRYEGAMLGLAIGDALGAPIEFKKPGSFEPISDLLGGGIWNLEPGQWTDDTSMTLCLAESLLHCKGSNPEDQMNRYWNWYKEGYMSCLGKCFDIGLTVKNALKAYKRTGNPYSGSTDPRSAGNGSLMRILPVSLYFLDTKDAIIFSEDSSKTTHAAEEAVDACRYFTYLLCLALNGANKEEILSSVTTLPDGKSLSAKIADIAGGSFKQKHPPEIKGTGYVVDSLEAALWAFYNFDSFQECILAAVNLGDDADTTGAILGQLAGAYCGRKEIPQPWVLKLAWSDTLVKVATRLHCESRK